MDLFRERVHSLILDAKAPGASGESVGAGAGSG